MIIFSFWLYFHSDHLVLYPTHFPHPQPHWPQSVLAFLSPCPIIVLSSFMISWSTRVRDKKNTIFIIMNVSWFKRIDFVAHNHPCHPYHPCHLQQGPNTSHFRRMHGVLGKHHGRHCTHKAWGSQVPICWLFLSFFLFICLASFIPIVDFCSFVFCWKRRTDEWRWLQGGYVGQHLPLDADKIRGALISLNRNLQCLLLLFNFDRKGRSVDEILNC